MITASDALTALVAEAARATGYEDAPVPMEPCVPTADPKFGDYQSNFAFRLAKAIKANPRAVAEKMIAALPASEMVAKVEVAGPGFINFTLADAWIAGEVARRAASPSFGTPRPGEGRTMVIDYSSPNIAKRMHVGHLRSTVIGNALDRLHRRLGWTVVADNHVGDWGTQFGKLIVAWRRWRDEPAYDADPIGELQRLYQLFGDRAKEDPTLDDLARAETAKLQDGDADNRALWERFVSASMLEFDAMYARLGVKFDVVLGESAYRDRLGALVEDLKARGVAIDSDGAVVIPFDAEDGPGLANTPMLVRKRDGAALYGTTDLATLEHRLATWSPELICYVTDTRQQLHFQQLFAAARKLGVPAKLQHVWFGILRLPGGFTASTRAGSVINLVDLLDTAVEHARAVVDEKSGHLPEAERAQIAEAVGVGAVKYTDLSQHPQSDVHFDWDRMLSFEGNTAPYLMYAHARCHSIFRKAGGVPAEPAIQLGHPLERELALTLLRVPEAMISAAQTWRPNAFCDQMYAVATTFSRFFGECRVIDAEPEVRESRLGLVSAVARALSVGLDTLGLSAPERL